VKTADGTAVVVALVGTTMMVELELTGGTGTTVVEVGATAAGVVEMGGATGTVGGATVVVVVVGCSQDLQAVTVIVPVTVNVVG
jgi:hypothetical protein